MNCNRRIHAERVHSCRVNRDHAVCHSIGTAVKSTSNKARILLMTLALLAFGFSTYASTKTSTSTGGVFATATTWVGGVAPVAGDDVIIADGATVTVAATTVSLNSITVGQGTSGILNFNTAAAGVTVTGTTTISAGAQLINSTVATATRQFGSLIVNGTWSCTAASPISLSGSLTVNTGATFTASTGVYTLSGAAQTIGGTIAALSIPNLTIPGTYTNNIPTLTISTALAGTGTLTMGTNSTMDLSGTGATAISITTLNCTANIPNTIVYDGAAPTEKGTTYDYLTISTSGITTVGAATTVNGDLNITSGSFSIGTTLTLGVTGNTNISSGATLTYASTGAGTFTGNFTNNGTWSNTAVAALNFAGNVTNNGTFTASTGVYTLSGTGTTISGSTAALTIANIAVTGTVTSSITTFTVSTALSGTGTLTMGTNATLTLSGTAATAISLTNLNCTANTPNTVVYNGAAPTVKAATYYNLTTSTSGIATCATPGITVNNNLAVTTGTLNDGGFQIAGNSTGTLSVSNGATLQIGNATATTEGFPTLFATANIALGATSTVNYAATGAQTIATAIAGAGPASYGNLTATGASVKTLSGTTIVTTNFNNATAGETFTLGGDSLYIGGTYSNTGTLSANTTGSNLILNGSTAVTFTIGTTTPATGQLMNLTISKTAGVAVTLGGAVVVNNNLAITSGTLATGTLGLTAANTSVTGILSVNGATATKALGTTIINPGGAINSTVAATITTTSLTISAGGTWSTATAAAAVTITGDLDNAGTFSNTVATTYSLAGNITNDGTFTSGTGLYTLTGASKTINTTLFVPLSINSVTISGTGVYTVSPNFTGSALFSIPTALTISAAANSLTNNGNMSVTSATVTLGSLTNNDSLSITTTLAGTGSYINSANSNLNFAGASITVTTFNVSASGNTVVYDGSAAQTIRSGITYYNLAVAITGAFTASVNAASTTVSNNLTAQSGTLSDGGFQIIGNGTGVLTVAAGATLQMGVAGATTTNFPTLYTTAGISLSPASTVIYNTTSAITISTLPTAYGNLTLSSASIKTAGAAETIQGNLTINAGTFADGGNTITVNGNITNSGAHTGAGMIYLAGGSAVHTLSGTGSYTNLQLNDAAGANMAASFTINGTLTLASGTYSVGAFTLTLDGPALAGTGTNLSATTTSTLVFGPVTNANTGLYVPSSVSNLSALTIDIVATNKVAINSSITLNSAGTALTLTSGLLNLGSNTLTVGSTTGTISGGSASSYVVADGTVGGQLLKQFPAATNTSFTYPVGSSAGIAGYSPVTFTSFNPTGGTETIGVDVTGAVHPQINSNQTQTNYITRYWSFTESGTATSYSYANVALTYLTADEVGTVSTANDQINRYNGSWYTLNSTIANPTATTSASNTNITGALGGNDYTVRLNAATTYTWNNNAGGTWTTPTNWTPTRTTPANSDVLIFNGSVTPSPITVTAVPVQSISQLQAINGANVSLQSATTSTTLTLGFAASSNVLTIDAASTLQLSSTGTNVLTLAFPALSALSASIAGTLVINANTAFTNTLNFTNLLAANNTITGTITNNGGVVTATAATTAFGANSFYNHNMNGGVIPTATWNATSTVNVTGTVATNPTGLTGTFGNLTWNNTAQTATGVINGAITLPGNLTVSAGTLNFNGLAVNVAGAVTNNGTINTTTAGSTLNMDGTSTQTISGSGAWTTGTAGRLLNLTVNNAAGITLSPTLAIQTDLTLTAGVLTASALTIGVPATAVTTIRTAGSLANVPGFNFTTGVYNITYNGTSTSYTVLNELPPSTTPTNGTLTVSLATTSVTQDKDAFIGELVTSVAGATYNINGFNLGLSLATPTSNTGTITANAATSTIHLNGTAAAQTLTTSTGTYTGNLISNLIVDNSFATGVILGTQSATLGFGNVTINSSRLFNLSTTGIKIAGTYTNNGTLTGNGAGATITLNGTSAQTFSIGTYTGSVLSNFIVNNTAGVTLTAPLSVSTVFTLTNGILATSNTNLLTITATTVASVVGGTAASYVDGPMARTLPASLVSGSTYAFPIGGANYNLFEIVNPTTSSAGTVIVTVQEQDALAGGTDGVGFSSSPNPARYWQAGVSGAGVLTSGGTVQLYDATMTLTTNNVIGNSPTVTGTYTSLGDGAVNTPATGDILSASTAPVALGCFKIGSKGCLSGYYTIGATGASFTTLSSAIATINSSFVCSNLLFEFTSTYAGTTETFPITLNAVNYTGGPWNIIFRPGAGVSAVTSGNPGSNVNFININGADNVTFDGRAGGAGSTPAWIIRNTQTAATYTPAIQFANDATIDTLEYLQIESQNASTTSGTIYIGTAATTGNDNLFIDHNIIRDRSDVSGTPLNAIYALGTAAKVNDNVTISNNQIFNFWNASTASNGIDIQSNNSNFNITGNSFYQTASRTQTAGVLQTAITINNTSGNSFVVTGNYIGGTAANAGGTAWTVGGAVASTFIGIDMSVGSATASSVEGNTITNMNWSSTGTIAVYPGIFSAIYVLNGAVNIGDVTGNTIGATTGTGALTITSGSAGGNSYGIVNVNSNGAINISNNNIGSVSILGTGTTISHNYTALLFSGGLSSATTKIISGNTIGSTTTANSINCGTASTSTTAQSLMGINFTAGSGGTAMIQNNTIANLNNNYASTGAGLTAGILIPTMPSAATITGNNVYNISTSSQTTGTGSASSLIGIAFTSSTTGHTISNNQIYSLSNTAASAAVTGVGLFYSPATGGTNTLNANLIHSISLSTSGAGVVNGLLLNAGSATVSNNMIRLGIDASGNSQTNNLQINGINDVATTNNIYFNSIYIGGTGVTTGAANTYAYYGVVTTGTRLVEDNIFWNARTNSGGTGKHYALHVGALTGLTCNYNDLLSSTVLGSNGTTDYTTFSAWQSQTGTPDVNSVSGNPQFINATGNAASVNLNISTSVPTPIEGVGLAIAGITTDFNGKIRANYTPTDIGADADNFIPLDVTPPVIGNTTLSNTCNGVNTYTVSGITITDASGVDVSPTYMPRLYYKKSTSANISAGWSYVQTTSSSSPFSFTIDFTALGGVNPADVIQYFVTAQDLAPTPNVAISGGSTFAATPANDVLTSAAFPIGGTISSFTILPCQGTVNIGTTAAYQGLTPSGGIFQAINSLPGGLNGNLTISVTSNLALEDGTNPLTNAKLNGYSVHIVPSSATLYTISNASALSVPMIPFNGAIGVTIDGSYSGSGKYLKFRNTHTTATSAMPAVQYYGSASVDTLKNAIIESNASTVTTGAVLIGTGTNTGIVISGNTITTSTGGTIGSPANGVYSNTSTNSGCTISGNNFENATNAGVLLGTSNGSAWTITRNNFYQFNTSTLAQSAISVGTGNGHTITYNIIGGTAAGATGTWTNTGSVAVTGINLTTLTTGTATVVDSNTILNISVTGTGASSFTGINAGTGLYDIGTTYGNTISTISTAGTGITTGIISTSAGTATAISKNTVFGLANTNTGATTVKGIYLTGTSTSNVINKNLIYNLVAGTNASSVIDGIEMSGAGTLSNNMIRLGYDASGNNITNTPVISGILKDGAVATNTWFNSIYIGGSGVSTTANNTYALRRTATAADDIRDNILVNARANSTTGGIHYALVLNATTTATSNYNIFYAPNTGGSLFSQNGGTTAINTIQAWNAGTATLDTNSGVGNPNFIAPTSVTANLQIANPSPAESAGINIAAVTDDFFGNIRALNTPVDIGADAVNVTPVDIYRPVITTTAIPTQSTACGGGVSATVTATITDVGTGVAAAALWYRRSLPATTSWTYVSGTLTSGTGNNGTWTFALSIPTAANGETYQYYFVAGDGASNLNYAPFDATTPVHSSVTTQVTAPNTPYSFATSAGAPLSGTVTVGSGGTYPTFNGAGGLFAAINSYGLSSNLTVTVVSNILETTTTPLNQITSYCGGPYSILIQPSGTTMWTDSGSISGSVGLITFNGADSVTIDGEYAGDGLQHLHFRNTLSNYSGTGYNATFYLYNDASHNTIKNTIIEGLSKAQSSGVITGGVVMLGTGVSEGNSYNTFSNNMITGTVAGGGSDASTCLLFSQGSTGAPNANNQILNNSFKDFSLWSSQMADNYYGATYNRCYGLDVCATGNGSNWTVTGNSFYTTFPENHGTFTALSFQPGSSSTNNLISGNYIGGSAPQCGMSSTGAFKMMGSTYNSGGSPVGYTETRYEGMIVNAGNAYITDNTIKRIWIENLYYSGFIGMDIEGSTNVTITNNIFGGTVASEYTDQYNTVGTDIIEVDGGGGSSGEGAGYMYGIWTLNNVTLTADSNTFNYIIQNGAGDDGGTVQCILHEAAGGFNISNNTNSVEHQECWGMSYNAYAIQIAPTASSSGNVISNNKLSTVRVDGAYVNQVRSSGIYINIPSGLTVSGTINNNQIYDNISVENSGYCDGIFLDGVSGGNGTWNVYNNMIYLNNGGNTNRMSLTGINIEMNSASVTNVTYNSVWVAGSHNTNSGVSNNCFALWRYPGGTGSVTGDACTVKNNILMNTRTGGNSSTFFCAIANEGTYTSGFTSDYNFLMNNASASGGRNDMGVWGTTVYSSFASWQTNTAQDAHGYTATDNATTTFSSGNLNPVNLFTNPAISDLHIAYTNGTSAYQFIYDRATPVSITTDYDYQTRSATTPEIGADEFSLCSPITITAQPASQVLCSGSNGQFGVKNTGGSPYTYQWQESTDHGNTWSVLTIAAPYSTDAAGDTLDITGATTSIDSTLYRVQISNSCGVDTSASAYLTVMSGSANAYLTNTSDSLLLETCPDGGWTYYATVSQPTRWLFAINKNGNTFTATPEITMHFTNPTAYDSVANTSANSALYTMNRYWNVTINSGSIDTNVGKVSVRFFYNPADTLAMTNAANAWALAHPSTGGYTTSVHSVEWFKTVHTTYNPANNTASSVPTAYTFASSSYTYGVENGVNYVELDNIVSFSGGTAAIRVAPTSGAPIALPVKLLYLTATDVSDQYIRLDWATASEIDNKGFDIERSTDAVTFTSIGWVNGQGNSTVTTLYTLPDHSVNPDVVYYYRLKQEDVDGNFTYSDIVSASISRSGIIIGELIPNPSATSTAINIYSSFEQTASIQIYNTTGQLVRVIEQNIYTGANNIEFNVADLASGLYVVNINIGGQYTSRKLIVK